MTDVIPVQSCYLGVVYRLDHPALVGAWSGETFLVVNVQGTVVPVAHTAARPMELVAIVPGGVPLVAGNETLKAVLQRWGEQERGHASFRSTSG